MANQILSSETFEVADRLHSAAIHLLRRVRRVDEATGLTAARLSALSVLVFGGPTTIGDLARMEQVSAPTISRLVAGLERDGLVLRESDDRDARVVRLRATDRGHVILARGREQRVAELVRVLDRLSASDLATLASAASVIEHALTLSSSAADAYPGTTAERRWSDLGDDSTGSGGTRR
jgi:DNA-binding MarR family transcriptional regulator